MTPWHGDEPDSPWTWAEIRAALAPISRWWDEIWCGPLRMDAFGWAVVAAVALLLAAVSWQIVTGQPL